jgi:hypothetical protein
LVLRHHANPLRKVPPRRNAPPRKTDPSRHPHRRLQHDPIPRPRDRHRYRPCPREAHTLIRTALAGSGDIIPDHHTLHIRVDPLAAPRDTAAIAELCQALNTTDTVDLGTTLTLRYSVKSHRGPHTNY